jgi:LPXTG-motif cell wall-anchored protein
MLNDSIRLRPTATVALMRDLVATRAAMAIGLGVIVVCVLSVGGLAHGAPGLPGAPASTTTPDDPVPNSSVPGSLIPPVSWNGPDDPDVSTVSTEPAAPPSSAARVGAGGDGTRSTATEPASTAGVAGASSPPAQQPAASPSLPVTGSSEVWLSLSVAVVLLAAGALLVRISRRNVEHG